MRLLLSKRETARLVGCHPEHLMRLSRAGKFPRPIKVGGAVNCACRFIADEVEGWVSERMADRNTAVAKR